MRVGYVQFAPVFGEKEKNIETILRLLDLGVKQGADLLVLPELCNTGYVFRSREEVESLSEEIPEGGTTEALIKFAEKGNIYIVAGLCEKEDEKYFNSAVLLGPKGFIDTYRKAHLFHREKLWFSRGNTPFKVHDILKAKVGMMICFDWFFPEVARILALEGAHIICHPANLVLPYCQKSLLGAAIQNRVFIVTANRIGVERGVKFTGRSQIISPEMKVLAKSGANTEEVKVVQIDPATAENKRITEYNDLREDRRIDLYRRLTK